MFLQFKIFVAGTLTHMFRPIGVNMCVQCPFPPYMKDCLLLVYPHTLTENIPMYLIYLVLRCSAHSHTMCYSHFSMYTKEILEYSAYSFHMVSLVTV